MKTGFARTQNYQTLVATVTQMEQRGAREASFILVLGEPTLGKSAAVSRIAIDLGAAVFRCKETWTPRALLDEMAEVFKLDKRGRNQEVQARIIRHLARARTLLVFDEIQHIAKGTASAMECIRDITDMTEVIAILVAGTEEVETQISRHPQIASRIGATVQFTRLNETDYMSLVKQKSTVELDKPLLVRLYTESAGKARLVLNGLGQIERVAKANNATRATAEMLEGIVLCEEWQARRAGRRGAGV